MLIKQEAPMVIHKKTRLTPVQRKDICDKHFKDKIRVSDLSHEFHVSRPTIYKILHRGRKTTIQFTKVPMPGSAV